MKLIEQFEQSASERIAIQTPLAYTWATKLMSGNREAAYLVPDLNPDAVVFEQDLAIPQRTAQHNINSVNTGEIETIVFINAHLVQLQIVQIEYVDLKTPHEIGFSLIGAGKLDFYSSHSYGMGTDYVPVPVVELKNVTLSACAQIDANAINAITPMFQQIDGFDTTLEILAKLQAWAFRG